MSWQPEIRRRILVALKHGGLNPYELAAMLEEAPFRIHQELKQLRRDGFVRASLHPDHVEWALTGRGELVAWNAHQEQLPL